MRGSISKQILLVGLLIVAAFTALNVYAYLSVKNVELSYRQALTEGAPVVGYAKEFVGELWCQNAQSRGYMLSGDTKYVQYYRESVERSKKLMAAIAESQLSPQAKQEFELVTLVTNEYQKSLELGITMRNKMGLEETIKYLSVSGDKVDTVGRVTEGFITAMTEEMQSQVQHSEATIHHLQLTMLVVDILILIGAVVSLLVLTRRIGRPLAAVVESANRIAAGDFRLQAINYQRQDEIGNLVKAFAAMSAQLRELIGQVAATAEQVASSSEQLTAGAEQSAMAAGQVAASVTEVARGTVSQVEAINRTVGIVEDMAAAIRQIAINANNVSGKSGETTQAAVAGGAAVNEATGQMSAISHSVNQTAEVVKRLGESSKQIGEIVDVISGIAGQTNLLALNAAIEAARAGEQGRGFAVVAEEVRKLAEQSQEAAGKIAEIIREIQGETDNAILAMNKGTSEVTRGTQVITATGERFKHIIVLIQELNQQIQEISGAAEEVSASSTEVVASVDSVKAVAGETAGNTQTISAAAEEQSASMQEIASSSQGLSKVATELQSAISRFRM
jgi:methyl-accepting chemotaxis protein